MDTNDCPLMGAHGYCSQEMVHLMLVGKATSNTFDGDKVLDDGNFVLKGIQSQSDIGLLSLFEHYDSIVVGNFLKMPTFPIWLVCAESHFTVLFGLKKGTVRSRTNRSYNYWFLYIPLLLKIILKQIVHHLKALI